MKFAVAQKVADTVLYEGYVLYPYRASSMKNRARFQFGVVVPRRYGAETVEQQTECLVRGADPAIHVRLRFLQLESRTVTVGGKLVASHRVDGRLLTTWDGAVLREIDLLPLTRLNPREQDVRCPGRRRRQHVGDAIVEHRTWPLLGRVDARLNGDKVHIRFENVGGNRRLTPDSSRDVALRYSFIGLHTLMHVPDGSFVSLLDSPACTNRHTWPVLISDDVMLSSPIILYDYPVIAPESPGDFYDATEIDELLSLRVMTLTDEEKEEARATDPRAAAVVDQADRADLTLLHGTSRLVVRKGDRVRLHPGGRADAMDMFLRGRIGIVEDVRQDAEGVTYVAVTVEDDPAAELNRQQGRFFYFTPAEIEIIKETEYAASDTV